MWKKSVKRMTCALVAAAALASTGCGGSSEETTTDAQPVDGGDVNIAWFAQPASLDPIATTAYVTRDLVNNVFETLISYDKDYQVQPVLAKSYEESDDYKSVTFTLREGVKFQNGEEMKAADVSASMERWFNETSSGKAFFVGSQISTPDDYTVKVEFPTPLYTAVALMAQVGNQPMVIMPKASIEAEADGQIPQDQLIGTGPFKIKEWKQDSYITLERFADYTEPEGEASGLTGARDPHVDTLTYSIVPDLTTRQNGLSTGEYDYATELSTDSYDQLNADSNLETELLKANFIGMVFNKKSGPMADEKVRQAVQATLDMKAILSASWTEEQFDLNGALAPKSDKVWYTEAGLDNYNRADVEAGKKLLAESSYNGESVNLLCTRDYPYMYNSAVVVEQELEELGINVELVVTDWATVLANRSDPDKMDMFITTWSYAPPVSYSFITDSWPGWTSDPTLTAALDETNAATSEEEAQAANDELQEQFYNYVPITIFGTFSSFNAWNNDIGGVRSLVGPILYGAYRTE